MIELEGKTRKIGILGWIDHRILKSVKFNIKEENKKKLLIVFTGYAPNETMDDVLVNSKFIIKDLEFNLESVNLGYGKDEPLEYIPRGWKSLILINGAVDDIKTLRKELPRLSSFKHTDKFLWATIID